MKPLVEIPTSSAACQRWAGGQHSWRHTSEGGFDPARYEVEQLDEATAKAFVTGHHYSGTYPAASQRYALVDVCDDHRSVVGVLVLGIPTSKRVLTGPFPGLEPYVESLELSRLVLHDAVPANAESWFIAQCFQTAANRGVRGIVSFADPVPRIVDQRILFPGHVGTIYQATNAAYAGRGTPRTLTLLPDGTVLSARAMQKVRAQERGHRHVEELLIGWGAPAPRAFADPARWLIDALAVIGATKMRHRGNHRYCFRLGTPAQRRRVHLDLPTFPYPKTPDLTELAA